MSTLLVLQLFSFALSFALHIFYTTNRGACQSLLPLAIKQLKFCDTFWYKFNFFQNKTCSEKTLSNMYPGTFVDSKSADFPGMPNTFCMKRKLGKTFENSLAIKESWQKTFCRGDKEFLFYVRFRSTSAIHHSILRTMTSLGYVLHISI